MSSTDGSSQRTPPASALTLLQRHVAAINWPEEARFPVRLIDDGFRWLDHATATVYAGADGYGDYLRRWRVALPNLWLELQQYGGSDAVAVGRFWLRGTHTGALVTDAGTIYATGHEVGLAVCDIFEAENGRLTRIDTFYDRLTLLQQLGQIPDCRQQPLSRFLAN